MQIRRILYEAKHFHEMSFKTGDLILFKADNNYYSIIHGCYFGHIGMVIEYGSELYLAEAAGYYSPNIVTRETDNGIYVTKLYDRIARYKGTCYHKALQKPISPIYFGKLLHFIRYAAENFEYDESVISAGARLGFGFERCGWKTNCGQFIFLLLMCLDLLPISYYDKTMFHHLNYVTNITQLEKNKYLELIEIMTHPFGDSIFNK
jgi:hypothetical protein